MPGPSRLAFFIPCFALTVFGLADCVSDGESSPDADSGPAADAAPTDGSTISDAADAATNDADAAPAKCVFAHGGAAGSLDTAFQAQFYPNIFNAHAAVFDSAGA